MAEYNWSSLERHYKELIKDVYPQPIDGKHKKWMNEMITAAKFLPNCNSVLDVGAGMGDAEEMFKRLGMEYTGISIGSDWKEARENNKSIYNVDFNFMPEEWSAKFDLVWARHSLEHSPFPLLTLMEFHRVSQKWLCLILPNPEHFGWVGRNHYSVLPKQQARWLLRRAGWKIVWREYTDTEFRFICKKEPRISSEGWSVNPVPNNVYEDDRDG